MNFHDYINISEIHIKNKIFNFLDKEKKNHLSLQNLTDFMGIFFSKNYPTDENKFLNVIFSILIEENQDMIILISLIEFLNYIILEAIMKAKIQEFKFYNKTRKYIKNYVIKVFSTEINNLDKNSTLINNEVFTKIFLNHPDLLKIVKLSINLITPINEKFLDKISKNEFNFYSNDDFEAEYDIEDYFDEKDRLVNRYNIHHCEDINSLKKKKIGLFSETSKKFNSFLNLKKKISGISIEDFSINNYNNISCIKEWKYSEINDTKLNNDISINTNAHHESSLNNCLFYDLKKLNYIKNIYIVNNLKNENYRCNFNDYFNNLECPTELKYYINNKDKILIKCNLKNEEKNEFKEDILNNDFTNSVKYKTKNFDNNKKFVSCPDFIKNQAKDDLSDDPIDKISDTSFDDIGKKKIIDNNIFFKYTDYINGLKLKEYELYENLLILIDKIKNKKMIDKNCDGKYKVIFLKKTSKNLFKNNESILNSNKYDLKYPTLSPKNIELLENGFSMKMKFVGNDMLLYRIDKLQSNQDKNIKSKSLYFYKLSNVILSDLPEREYCKIKIKLDTIRNFYYLSLSILNQKYEIYFENYEELENFYSQINSINKMYDTNHSLIYKYPTNKLFLIHRLIKFKKFKEKFFNIHEIISIKGNLSCKLISLNKEFMKDNNKKYLTNLFFICKLNNLLKIDIFPIRNVYQTENFFIIEFTNDDFIIDYDHIKDSFVISVKNLSLCDFYSKEFEKFKKLIKVLKIKDLIGDFFHLIRFHKSIIFPKFLSQ